VGLRSFVIPVAWTHCAICWLKEDYGFDEVVAVMADVGQEYDLEQAIERGEIAGAKEIVVARPEGALRDGIVAQAIKTNALYEGRYPSYRPSRAR